MAKKPFDQLAEEAPKKGDEVNIGPDSNMAALMGMADEILAEPIKDDAAPAAGGEAAPMDAAPAEEAPTDAPAMAGAPADDMMGGTDLSPIVGMVKENNPAISDAEASQQAEDLWNAAGERSDLAQMTPDELTAELKKDTNLLMELKKLAAKGEQAGEMDMSPADPMGASAGVPPMDALAGGMPPGM